MSIYLLQDGVNFLNRSVFFSVIETAIDLTIPLTP